MLSADDAAPVLAFVVGAVAVDPVGAFSFVAVAVPLLFLVPSAGVALSVSVAGLSVVPLPVAELSVDASTLELFVDVAVVPPVAASF
ncbi:Uncharacterised protein [Staphylococcus aureus]|nr:Uncharacterised protein [Staphylococcus aureus]